MKDKFQEIIDQIKHLRSDEGCPWDRKQTVESFGKNILDEAKEVQLALDNNDMENLKEELGDLIWNCIALSNIAEEEGKFTAKEVLEGILKKMYNRHPHVYGDEKTDCPDEALRLFNEQKKKEKERKNE